MIQEISTALGGASEGVVYALLAFVAITLLLQIAALIDVARRDEVLGGRKWLWVLVILLVSNGLGAIGYFIIGRKSSHTPVVEEPGPAVDTDTTSRAVGVLYGPDER